MELLEIAARIEAYDPSASLDNRADELELHRDVVMATGIGTMNPTFEDTFLRSLDAAMGLAPEGWQGDFRFGIVRPSVLLWPVGSVTPLVEGRAATPARALTAACLRALVTSEPS